MLAVLYELGHWCMFPVNATLVSSTLSLGCSDLHDIRYITARTKCTLCTIFNRRVRILANIAWNSNVSTSNENHPNIHHIKHVYSIIALRFIFEKYFRRINSIYKIAFMLRCYIHSFVRLSANDDFSSAR